MTLQRRSFITILGASAAAWPLGARAQQPAMPIIGVLVSGTAEDYTSRMIAFKQGLADIGLVEGRNFGIDIRLAEDQYDRFPEFATEFVRMRVALIVAMAGIRPARAAKDATTVIPIVFVMGADPVQSSLVAALNRPGGNITGVTGLNADIIQKRMQLLHDTLPNARTFGCLINPNSIGRTADGRMGNEVVQDTARALGMTLHIAPVQTVGDFDAAFASLEEKRVEAVFTTAHGVFYSGEHRLIELATQYRLPMMYPSASATKAGGLMSYSASSTDALRQAGRYAGRILKGEKPADLPVLLPTKFEFVVNLRTAKALNLDMPPGVLAIVDEVIE
jgi:ABC-type uncharacterized transport system substrate-binding protein